VQRTEPTSKQLNMNVWGRRRANLRSFTQLYGCISVGCIILGVQHTIAFILI
jgi:hypothetical protein